MRLVVCRCATCGSVCFCAAYLLARLPACLPYVHLSDMQAQSKQLGVPLIVTENLTCLLNRINFVVSVMRADKAMRSMVCFDLTHKLSHSACSSMYALSLSRPG